MIPATDLLRNLSLFVGLTMMVGGVTALGNGSGRRFLILGTMLTVGAWELLA